MIKFLWTYSSTESVVVRLRDGKLRVEFIIPYLLLVESINSYYPPTLMRRFIRQINRTHLCWTKGGINKLLTNECDKPIPTYLSFCVPYKENTWNEHCTVSVVDPESAADFLLR